MSITLSCPKDPVETRVVGRCWNWLKRHTYRLVELTGSVWKVTKISGWLNAGPSELNEKVPIKMQIMKYNATTWEDVATYDVMADKSTHTPFSYEFDEPVYIRAVRFYSPDHYVDGSSITLEGEPYCPVRAIISSFELPDTATLGEKFTGVLQIKNLGCKGRVRVVLRASPETVLFDGVLGKDETRTFTTPQIMMPDANFKDIGVDVYSEQYGKMVKTDTQNVRVLRKRLVVPKIHRFELPHRLFPRAKHSAVFTIENRGDGAGKVWVWIGTKAPSYAPDSWNTVNASEGIVINKYHYCGELTPGATITISGNLPERQWNSPTTFKLYVRTYVYENGYYVPKDSLYKEINMVKPFFKISFHKFPSRVKVNGKFGVTIATPTSIPYNQIPQETIKSMYYVYKVTCLNNGNTEAKGSSNQQHVDINGINKYAYELTKYRLEVVTYGKNKDGKSVFVKRVHADTGVGVHTAVYIDATPYGNSGWSGVVRVHGAPDKDIDYKMSMYASYADGNAEKGGPKKLINMNIHTKAGTRAHIFKNKIPQDVSDGILFRDMYFMYMNTSDPVTFVVNGEVKGTGTKYMFYDPLFFKPIERVKVAVKSVFGIFSR